MAVRLGFFLMAIFYRWGEAMKDNLGSIFLEIARQHAAERQETLNPQTYNMYCESCGKDQPHTLRVSGDYEIYTCPEGHFRAYKVK